MNVYLFFFFVTDTNQHSDLAQQVFSPEQFIYRQKSGHQSQLERKPAISFQQQQFQNGGSLTVTNSHVTVTTHTASGGQQPIDNNNNKNNPKTNNNNVNNQFNSKSRDTYGYASNSNTGTSSSSSTSKPLTQYNNNNNYYNAPSFDDGLPLKPSTSQQLPKRIPLLPLSISQQPPSGHPGVSQIPSFRLPAQGFRLHPISSSENTQTKSHTQLSPSTEQQQQHSKNLPFEGYRRQLQPQVFTEGAKLA